MDVISSSMECAQLRHCMTYTGMVMAYSMKRNHKGGLQSPQRCTSPVTITAIGPSEDKFYAELEYLLHATLLVLPSIVQ